MNKTELQEAALKLPAEDRAALMETLHLSLIEEPLTDWQKQLLDERIAEDDRDPDGTLPGEELLARLRKPRA
ncbi:MAG TPA: addiction module protein [Thermoanaerobaculia bacterium]|jgi:putative addiction module component (TIGR02574 family)|nr:addiction module protein [Thermoanaerobaculia bacterium]